MAEEYQKLIEQAEASLYGTKRILLPAPQCIVFYNGKQDMQKALNVAISYCIDHDILSDFLKKYQAEVLGMLLEEFDVEKYERTIRKESWEEGKEEGRAEGIEIGILQQQAETIYKLLSKGMSEEQVADMLEISKEQIEKEAKKKGIV